MKLFFLTALCLTSDALAFAPSVSSRRGTTGVLRAVDKTKEGEYPHPANDDYQFGDITKRMIRDATGDKDYEFGDGSKALASATTDAAETAANAVLEAGGTAVEAGAAAKKVLDDSGYEFGDFTKGAVEGFEEKMKSATGDEDYKFGDVTKGLVSSLGKTATGNEDYKFGDVTKNLAQAVGKQATGNDDYKFGDMTKNLAKGLFGAVEKGAAAAKKRVDEPEN